MSNFDAAQAFVDFGLSEKEAGRRESASGPGSTLEATEAARRLIDQAIRQFGVRSILDLGCGDWNWMRKVERRLPDGTVANYHGWEANKTLVSWLNQNYADEQTHFQVADAVADPFPKVDLVIARDILFHMQPKYGLRIVEKAKNNRSLLISTSFMGVRRNGSLRRYIRISGWGFYKINLNAPPFSLADTMRIAYDEPRCSHTGSRRFICLFDFTEG